MRNDLCTTLGTDDGGYIARTSQGYRFDLSLLKGARYDGLVYYHDSDAAVVFVIDDSTVVNHSPGKGFQLFVRKDFKGFIPMDDKKFMGLL